MSCMQLEEVRGEADGIRSELAQFKVHYYNNYIDDHDQYTCTYRVINIIICVLSYNKIPISFEPYMHIIFTQHMYIY